jgi:hypothetical protein
MSAPSIKLQPKRRGTDAASAWARALRLRLFDERGDGKARIINTGIPAKDVKHLLLTIAQYVDHEGRCFPSFQTLADDTEMSWDSIKRRLADLEYLNLIARFRRWRDENGDINEVGRGRETSGEIRLLFDTSQEEIDALLWARQQGGDGKHQEPDEEASAPPADDDPRVGCANSPPQTDVAGCAPVPTRGAQSSTPLNPLNPSLNQEPPAPKGGLTPNDGRLEGSPPPSPERQAAKDRFKATYPRGSMRPEQFDARWSALTDAEIAAAQRAADGLAAEHRRNPKLAVLDPAKFIGSPALWADWSRYAPAATAGDAGLVATEFVIAVGSEAWQALCVLHRIVGFDQPRPRALRDGSEGLVTRWSPESLLPLARHAASDPATWLLVRKHMPDQPDKQTPQFVAWAKRIQEWTGRYPDGNRVWIDEAGRPVATAAEAHQRTISGRQISDCATGLRVPSEWPPAKGGSDPPSAPT